MTSPSLTLTSSPSPTATTSAVWGFSLAVSGSTMPEGVVSSRSTSLTSALSPRGLNFISLPPLLFGLHTTLRRTPRLLLALPTKVPARDCNCESYLTQLQAEPGGELVLGEGADRLLGHLAILEAGDGRDARYAVVHGGGGGGVDVEVDEPHGGALLEPKSRGVGKGCELGW